MIRVSINGFGRIGRAFFRLAFARDDIEIVAINDLADISAIAYLLDYDSVYGRSGFDIQTREGENPALIVNGKEVRYTSIKDPSQLPWKELNVDVVVESTGFFTSYEKSQAHITAGAKRVVISAPVKGDSEGTEAIAGATVLLGINEDRLPNVVITSNASCTTNASSPVMQILHETVGIEKALLNTVHAYTASQSLVDGISKKHLREGRAAAQNIVPSTTGAAIAVTLAIPDLENKFDGIALRVPVVAGSIADITFIAKRDTSVEEINEILKKAAAEERWKGVFTTTEEPLVSTDILGSTYASIADLGFTKVVGGNLVKVLAWYDNEIGYTSALVEHVVKAGNLVVG